MNVRRLIASSFLLLLVSVFHGACNMADKGGKPSTESIGGSLNYALKPDKFHITSRNSNTYPGQVTLNFEVMAGALGDMEGDWGIVVLAADDLYQIDHYLYEEANESISLGTMLALFPSSLHMSYFFPNPQSILLAPLSATMHLPGYVIVAIVQGGPSGTVLTREGTIIAALAAPGEQDPTGFFNYSSAYDPGNMGGGP